MENGIFSIHSSVERLLCCFRFLAIIDKDAMNMVEHVSLWDVGVSSGICPVEKLKNLNNLWVCYKHKLIVILIAFWTKKGE